MRGIGDVTNQSDDHSSGTNDFHAQLAEEKSDAGEAATSVLGSSTWSSVLGSSTWSSVRRTRGSARGREMRSREATPESGQLKTRKKPPKAVDRE